MSEFREEVVAMFQAKKSVAHIADELGLAEHEVYRDLAESGIKIRQVGKNPGGLSNSEADSVVKLYQEKVVPVQKLTEQFDLTNEALYALLEARGIQKRTEQEKEEKKNKLEEALQLYYETDEQGEFKYPLWKIRILTGISESTINRTLHLRGAKTRREIKDAQQVGSNEQQVKDFNKSTS